MRTLHRIVATGAIGGAVAASVAASGAFACTAQANVKVWVPGTRDAPSLVAPGSTVEIHADTFYPTAPGSFSEVEITLQTPSGVILPIMTRPAVVQPVAPGEKAGSPELTERWTVPTTIEKSLDRAYLIVATQRNSAGLIEARPSVPFFVWEGPLPAAAQDTQTVVPPAPVQDAAPETSPAPVQRPDTPAPVTAGPAASPAGERAPSAGRPAASPAAGSAAAPGSAAPATAAPATAAGVPSAGTATAAPAAVGELPADSAPVQPLPAAGDLWSGLDAGSTPSLLDPPAAPEQRRSPVGLLLLGGGVLALGAVALASGRRRLALSRR